jgi:hypothetical protein
VIEYGVACLVVLALSLADRRVTLYALTILVGWAAGFTAYKISPEESWRIWPLISMVSALCLLGLSRRHAFWWSKPVAALAGAMLMLDGLYVVMRYQSVQIEVEYARALDLALIAQLSLIGWGGLRGGWGVLLARMRGSLRRGRFPVFARRSRSEGAG